MSPVQHRPSFSRYFTPAGIELLFNSVPAVQGAPTVNGTWSSALRAWQPHHSVFLLIPEEGNDHARGDESGNITTSGIKERKRRLSTAVHRGASFRQRLEASWNTHLAGTAAADGWTFLARTTLREGISTWSLASQSGLRHRVGPHKACLSHHTVSCLQADGHSTRVQGGEPRARVPGHFAIRPVLIQTRLCENRGLLHAVPTRTRVSSRPELPYLPRWCRSRPSSYPSFQNTARSTFTWRCPNTL